MQPEPPLVFASSGAADTLQVRVNFGLFAGREVTAAELVSLASELVREVGEVSVVAEQRHEANETSAAAIHQVRVDLAADRDGAWLDGALAERVVEVASEWARSCIGERHAERVDAWGSNSA